MMEPRVAIVMYLNNDREAALERFDVSNGNLVNPRRLTQDNMRDVYEALESSNVQTGFQGVLPMRTLSMTRNSLTFALPAQFHTFLLDTNDKGVKPQKVWCPPIVFHYQWVGHHTVHVFLCRQKELDSDKGPTLWPAPFMNTDHRGNVCIGDTMDRVKFGVSPVAMAHHVTRCFLMGTFNEWRDDDVIRMMKVMTSAAKDRTTRTNFWRHASTLQWQRARKPLTLSQLGNVNT